MVQALHAMGLSVVFDTVYNHTFHSGVDGTPCFAAPDAKVVVMGTSACLSPVLERIRGWNPKS